ncbi:uncharacterized protein LOC128996709 [Macrosteles quadrilineatus]|uniref:uncharacterized protein LOC128996709 n=1 Tax=Macrosteles quadrilineatus TaxID=74068 RepID=UPI0023E1F9A5|nr:uncharacterized protein LOC128996709 [Macrosteles quadrilineatus]
MLTLVIVAALLAVTTADRGGGLNSNVPRTRLSQQCAGVCKDSAKFSLTPGWTYVYNYEGTSTSEVAGSSNETSQIRILAKAHVTVSSRPCELILTVRDVELLDSDKDGLSPADGQKQFAAELEQFPLRFSFQDGRVEQLCPSADEPTWTLNIKRGLLSMLQNTMSDFTREGHLYEKDVSGSCETMYSVSPMMWSDVKVLKYKNLQSCSGRSHHTLGLPSSWTSGAKSTPIIKSEQICEQTIRTDNGTYLANSRCQESHVFAPFSNGASGVRTIAETVLSLDSIEQLDKTFPVDIFVNKRTGLMFEYSPETDEAAVTVDQVWTVLNQLVAHSQLGVDDKVPQLFNQLVTLLAKMDDQQLVQLFDEVRDSRTRGYLLDALPLLGSSGSVWAMYQIYMSGEVTRAEVDQWLSALAFHQQPSLELVDRLALFTTDDYQPRTWLAAGAIIHSYCKHDPECKQRREVQTVLAKFEAVLGQSCQSDNSEEQQRMIVALKAIGNAGIINSIDTLEQCFTSTPNPVEVRLAAVAATRRMSCGQVSRLPLLRLLQDKSEDSELRIAAYLGVLQCPTTSAVSRLRDVLHGEDTNQVLSFIWTHLTNLQESGSRWRKEVRQMLQDTYFPNKFKTDARKFSRNYEMSAYSDILNSGVTVDSNIIFSTQSYLPRSANLNLTLDLFGETINMFEVGTRVEGFETVVESIFGPKGLFPDESMQKMLKNMRESNVENNGVIETMSKSFTKGTKNEPQGAMFVRILGNELYLTQFTGLGEFMDLKSVKKQGLKHLKESLSSIFTNKNFDYSKSFRFLNTEHVIPTILGLPLKVKVNGTASVGMRLKTELDFDNILKTSSGNIVLLANPSAAVAIDGKMTVDAVFSQASVETKGSLSSNTYLDTNIKVEKGKVIDVFVNVPRDKVEIINVTSAVYVKKRDQLVEIEGVGEVSEQDTCSGVHVPTLSGMRVCTQYVLRNASAIEDSPYFPLTGKFQYALALQKSDDFEFYRFHLKQNFNALADANAHFLRYYTGDFEIEMDTPGSKINRRLAAELFFDSKNGNAKLQLESPAGSVEFSGKLSVEGASREAELAAKVNGEDYVALKVGLRSKSEANNIMLVPSFLLQVVPRNLNVNVTGHFEIEEGSRYSGAFSAEGLTEQAIEVQGDVNGAKGRYSGYLAAKMGKVYGKVNTNIVNTAAVTSCKTQVRYVLPGRSSQSVDFTGKLTNHKRGGFTKKQLMVNLQMSQAPQYNTKVGWILYRTKMYVDSNVDLTVGKTQWKSQQLYHNNLQTTNKTFEVILSLESPSKNLDYRAELQYKTTDDSVHGHALAQLSSTKRFLARADYSDKQPRRTVQLEAASPWNRAALETELITEPAQGVNCYAKMTWGAVEMPRWISATGRYLFEETPLSATVMVEGKVEVIDWTDPIEFTGLWRAKVQDGLIISESGVTVFVNKEKYSVEVGYVKNSLKGKNDIEVKLNLPDNSYKGNFLLVNNQERKNVTVRLDLEKTLYFTTQLQLWKGFDLQLFWDYLEDRTQSVVVQYKTSPRSEVAVVSMPGHYASLTVDKLAPGFSSMNITAMWGESEGSATNAILLSSFWNFKMSSVYHQTLGYVAMPLVQANIHLTTPFVGFEQQSFKLNVNSVENPEMSHPEYSFVREFKVETKWQQQFVDFDFTHEARSKQTSLSNAYTKIHLLQQSLTSVSCSVDSSLEALREVSVVGSVQDQQEFSDDVMTHSERNHSLNVTYNNWVLTSNSTYTPGDLNVLVGISDKEKEETVMSGQISVGDNSIIVQSSFSPNKKVSFRSTYSWPYHIAASLETPFAGFEKSNIQHDFYVEDNGLQTRLVGEVGKEFFTFSTNLLKTQSTLEGNVSISSSSELPDVHARVEHEIYKDDQKTSLKEAFAVTLSKGDKVLHSSGLLSLVDLRDSSSSNTKHLKTLIILPGHLSSFNYSLNTQVKTTGVEKNHELNLLWNSERMQVGLIHEGLHSLAGFVKRNNDKKAELSFKKHSNSNYKMDLYLHGGYSIKHRLFFPSYTNWENFLAVTSPTGKLIVKNLQTLNGDRTSFVHKTTISLNKEVAYVDFVYNLDSKSMKVQNALFSTTTPWYNPVVTKYDLVVDTGATTKHEFELKYKQGQVIKGVFDITVSDKKHSASFNLYSPYCKDLSGKVSFENNQIESRGSFVLNADGKQLNGDLQLVKNWINPQFSVSLDSSNENIIKVTCGYNLGNINKNEGIILRHHFEASYYNENITLEGIHSFTKDSLKIDLNAETPIIGWKSLSFGFDSKLSRQYSMFVLNGKKDEISFVLSGTGSFQSDLVKVSASIDYSIDKVPQKHSTLFEYNRGRESLFVSFNFQSNDANLIDFNINLLKEPNTVENQDSYLFTYKAQTPLETLPDSDVEMRFIKNGKAQKITGDFNINNVKTTFKGENTFDSSGIGYLDIKVNTPDSRVGFLLKHTRGDDQDDSYSVQIINNSAMYIKGTVTILNVEKGLCIIYSLMSSVETFGDIEGTTVVKPGNSSYNFTSSLTVNGDNSNISYNVSISESDEEKTKHDLNVLVNFRGLETKFQGDLEYKSVNSELVQLKGQITDGKSVSSINYAKSSFSERSFEIDLSDILKISGGQNDSGSTLSLKTIETESIPNFCLDLAIYNVGISFKTESKFVGKIYFKAEVIDVKNLSISTELNSVKVNGVLHVVPSDSVNLKVTSNIPHWSELNILVRQSNIDYNKKNYEINVRKENQEIFNLNAVGNFNPSQGNGILSLTMHKFFINLELNYEFSSSFSLGLNYNINGNKQHTEGKLTLLPDSARLDLATPIKGLEDLTLISTLNRKNKKIGLVMERNGKTITAEMSTTVEGQRVILKGTVTDGKDEFAFSIGAQNGTADEPKSASFYITAFKNKLAVLMISLDGSYDLVTRAGIKFSFSSYFYKQIYFEISSLKEEHNQTFLINYMFGIDTAYSLKSTIVKKLSSPKLLIESNFGPQNTIIDISYDIGSPVKAVSLMFSHDDKLFNIVGNVSCTNLKSQVVLTWKNENVLNGLKDLNILGSYDFEDKSLIDALIKVNGVKYFDLSLKSLTLYETKFQSTLVSNKYINNSYHLNVDYNFALPDFSVSAHVVLNEEYYKSNANLTWNDSAAIVFYQLHTNAGYGFEKAVMSAHYITSGTSFSHFIDFTIDDSTLFHLASNISQPNRFSLDIILPDSLFLPFVKEISTKLILTEEEKKIVFKYLSGSQERRKLDLAILVKGHQCMVHVGRSEIYEEGNLQADRFIFSYKLLKNILEFETSMIWENNELFTVSFTKDLLWGLNGVDALLSPGGRHIWRVVFVSKDFFEFSGVVSGNQIQIVFTHPSTIYHKQLGITKFAYASKIEEFEMFKINYNLGDVVRSEVNFNSPKAFVMNLLNKRESYGTSASYEVVHQTGAYHGKEEGLCEGAKLTASKVTCDTLHYKLYQTNTDNPLSLHIKFNWVTSQLNGIFSKGQQTYRFGGMANISTIEPMCSGLSMYFNSSASPSTPFILKYETNCMNSLSASLNLFTKDAMALNVVYGSNYTNKSLYIQGYNIYYTQWNISGVLNNDRNGNVDINLDKNNIKVSFLPNLLNKMVFTVRTTYNGLRKLEISLKDKTANKFFVQDEYLVANFKLEGSRTDTEWNCEYKHFRNNTVIFNVVSNENLAFYLEFEKGKEISLKVNKNGQLYEGKGSIENSNENKQGGVILSLDGHQYELNFEHLTTEEGKINSSITFDTPFDQYFAKLCIQTKSGLRSLKSIQFMSLQYKTPYYPFDSGDIEVEYYVKPVLSEQVISLEEFNFSTEKEARYELSYIELMFKLRLKTNDINIEDALIAVTFGDKYSMNVKLDGIHLKLDTLLLNDFKTLASQTDLEIEGIDHPYLNGMKGKSFLKIYLNPKEYKVIALLRCPLVETVLVTSDSLRDSNNLLRTALVVYGKETILKFDTNVVSDGIVGSENDVFVHLYSQWQNRNILEFRLDIKQSDNTLSKINFDIDSELLELKARYSSEELDGVLTKSLKFNVNETYLGSFNPEVVFKRQIDKHSYMEYSLDFTNGFLHENYLWKGRGNLKIPDLSLFSIDTKPSIVADISVVSKSVQYASVIEVLFKRNKLDASVKWKRSVRPANQDDDQQFSSLLFGGEIQKNSAEFYLNNNRFFGSIESTKSQTSISVNLVNSNLNKNITVLASVQFTPVFLMTVSHTVFDSPCSVEIKVSRKPQYIESAVIVEYNSLKQQAYVNVYLDKNPRSIELVYIDIWQQIHQVSGQVEEKDEEMTIKGTINSPALDENFVIINVGNKNDKFDLNLSDMAIFKAFKDDESLLLNLLIFGNDYRFDFKNKSGVNELTLESPILSGNVIFSLNETLFKSFVTGNVHFHSYDFILDMNKNQLFNMSIENGTTNILNAIVEFGNSNGVVQLNIEYNYFNQINKLNLKHTSEPVLFVLSVNSSFYLSKGFEIMLGLKNEEVITGIFEVTHERPLLKSYLVLSKENRSLEMTAEAPLYSEMDKAKINGVFKFAEASDCEVRLSGALSSAETLMAHVSLHLINREDIFSSGLIIKNKLNNFKGVEITVDIPLQFSRDMKANFIVQLPYHKSYEFTSSLCISENKVASSAFLKWQEFIYSLDYVYGDTPFYAASYEWNIHYLDKKLQVGAWMKPKYPLTDYIYFVDLDEHRLVQLSHALLLQNNHFKSKLVLESIFKGYEKYGIDLELQNLKSGKIVKLLGSAPQIGTDLGVDFAFTYESLLHYAVLAQVRFPYDNQVKTAKMTSLQKIQRNVNYTKIKHSLECDDIGAVGWEFEMFGSAPFFWQGDLSALETKVSFKNATYSAKIKSYLQPDRLQVSCVLEAPLVNFQKGELHISGTKELVGSELVFSLNSNEVVNATISKDMKNNNNIKILSKWRNLLFTYLYEVNDEELGVSGYICWDLNRKDLSQLGLSVAKKTSEKYETSTELILPSTLVPKLGAKVVFANKINELFTLLQLNLPSISLEGKLACDHSPAMWKSGFQLKWTPNDSNSKDIGLFYVREVNEDETKTYFTLQHFALKNDIMLSTYVKKTLYGVNLQYSPLKEEEITLELSHWTVQDGDKDRTGIKFTALHPASKTLIYSLANATSTLDFFEGGISVAYSGKDYEKIKYVEIFGKKNRKEPQVFLGFSSNGNTLGVRGSVWKKENSLQGMTLEARVNQNDPFRVEVVQNLENPGVEAEISYSLSRKYRAYLGMPNSNELTASFSHGVWKTEH